MSNMVNICNTNIMIDGNLLAEAYFCERFHGGDMLNTTIYTHQPSTYDGGAWQTFFKQHYIDLDTIFTKDDEKAVEAIDDVVKGMEQMKMRFHKFTIHIVGILCTLKYLILYHANRLWPDVCEDDEMKEYWQWVVETTCASIKL